MTGNLGAVAFVVTASVLGSGCNESDAAADCAGLASSAEMSIEAWGRCETGDTCVRIGVGKECTGVISCGVSVNADARDEAESELSRIAEESRTCEPCARSSCAPPDEPACVAGRCR